jgi:hypothetical protein
MKRFEWHWLAACSLLLASIAAAEVRPQYGGTLRIAIHEAPSSLDPADTSQEDSTARRNLLSLIFETLITVDDRGRVVDCICFFLVYCVGNIVFLFVFV